MPKTEKVEKVEELKRRIEGSQAMFLADFRGLTVADASELRRSLRESGARFAVVKNTLMRRAAGETGLEGLAGLLEGPTAVAFVDGDPIAVAKNLVDAIRRLRTMTLKGGFMEGRLLSPEQAQALATIEPREVLLARLAGLAKAQMARAAYMFQALQGRFLADLEGYRAKFPAGEAVGEAEAGGPAELEAEAPAAEAEPTPEMSQEPKAEAPEPEAEAAAAEAEPATEAPQEPEEQPGAEPPAEAREESRPEPEPADEAEEAETPAEEGKE